MIAVSKKFTDFLTITDLYADISYKNSAFTWPDYLPYYFSIKLDYVLFLKHFKMLIKKQLVILDLITEL